MSNLDHKIRSLKKIQAEEENRKYKPLLNKVIIFLMQKVEYSVYVGNPIKDKLICLSVRFVTNGIIMSVLDLLGQKKMLKT